MEIAPLVGLCGDLLTFSGGLLLAVDVAQKEKDFGRIKKIATAITNPFMVRIKVEMDGLIVSDEADVERAFLHRSALKALLGCGLLSLGFLFLLAVRAIELWPK
jgi:hypothetical protein